jgi:hypothetical protein
MAVLLYMMICFKNKQINRTNGKIEVG